MIHLQTFESLIRSRSLKQLKKIAKMSKKTDIGHRTDDDKIPFYNIKNILDFDVDTYEKNTENDK